MTDQSFDEVNNLLLKDQEKLKIEPRPLNQRSYELLKNVYVKNINNYIDSIEQIYILKTNNNFENTTIEKQIQTESERILHNMWDHINKPKTMSKLLRSNVLKEIK